MVPMAAKVIRARGALDLQSCENLISDVVQDSHVALEWPKNSSQASIGGEALAVLALASWARNSPSSALHVYVNDSESASDFVRTFHGLAAALTAKQFLNIKTKADVSLLIRNAALANLAKLNSRPFDSLKGPTFLQLCADHYGVSTPSKLYNLNHHSSPVRASFESLAWEILTKGPNFTHKLSLDFTDTVGTILRELFLNTDQHATTDIRGRDLDLSLRGIFARTHMIRLPDIAKLAAAAPNLDAYLRALHAKLASKSLSLLELSVFDCGPGFASRLLKREISQISPDEELQAVQDCFLKHISSKLPPHRGFGLNLVAGLLRKKRGYLQVRTGRCFLCLTPDPRELSLSFEPTFGDAHRLAPTEGTAITILLPVHTQV